MKTLQSFFFVVMVSTSFSVFAERTLQSDPVKQKDIVDAVNAVLAEVGREELEIDQMWYANGAQLYRYSGGAWAGFGPSANLNPVDQRRPQSQDNLEKVGFHYMHNDKPAWNYENDDGQAIELVAVAATPVAGATDEDVSWLFVETDENGDDVVAVIRVHTRGGLPPSTNNYVDGYVHGEYYQTIYATVR